MRPVLDNLVWLLTGIGVAIIVMTRLRLRAARRRTGYAIVPRALVDAHTVVGTLALAAWVTYLVSPSEPAAYASLLLWWIEVVIGLLILLRWLPSSGSHAAETGSDEWSEGPWLSITAHGGLAVAVAFLTWCYLTGRI